jgi:hypothetical protein
MKVKDGREKGQSKRFQHQHGGTPSCGDDEIDDGLERNRLTL